MDASVFVYSNTKAIVRIGRLSQDAHSQKGKHEENHGNNQEQAKEDSSDGCRTAGHAGEPEQASHNRYDKRNQCPL